VSIANSGKKGEEYDFDIPKSYSLNFLDFDIDFGENCTEIVQYYSFSNEDHPENRLDFLNLVFVRLPKFVTVIKICNFTQMEQDEYIRRAMFRADLREQLRYAEDKGIDIGVMRTAKNMLAKGYSVAEVIGVTDLSQEQVLALR